MTKFKFQIKSNVTARVMLTCVIHAYVFSG